MNFVNYPFSAIVGQEQMKVALLLNMINPAIGGVLIQGEKGTAKTTAVRGLAGLMENGIRVVELPVSASEDRVVGTVNLKKVLREGEKQFDPGLLSEADGNILYVDEINLLEDHLVDVLLDAAATGVNRVERDGVSYTHSARFVLVGTMNPEEGTLRPQLLDRFGLCVSITSDLSANERAEVIRRRLAFESNPQGFAERFAPDEQALRDRLRDACTRYKDVQIPNSEIEYCAGLCAKMEVDGYRADITIMKAAMAIAALDGREMVTQEDVLDAAKLALPHRMKRRPFEEAALDEGKLLDAADNSRRESDAGEQDEQTKKALRQAKAAACR